MKCMRHPGDGEEADGVAQIRMRNRKGLENASFVPD